LKHSSIEQQLSRSPPGPPRMSGNLTVNVLNATGLKDSDGMFGGSSDPYVYLQIKGMDAQKTSVINDNLNPEWNETFVFENIEKPMSKILKVTVYDKDTVHDDVLGGAEIDLGTLRNVGEPQPFELEVDRHGPMGILGKAKLNLECSTDGWGNGPDGTGALFVNVQNAQGLRDADGMGAGASDPYVYLTIDGSESKQTSTQNDRLNPEWNEELVFAGIENPGSKILGIKVFDEDTLGDDKLGQAQIDLGTLTADEEQAFSLTVDKKGLGGIFGKATLNLTCKASGFGNRP